MSQTKIIATFSKTQDVYEPIPERRVKAALAYAGRVGRIEVKGNGRLGGRKSHHTTTSERWLDPDARSRRAPGQAQADPDETQT